MVWVVDLRTGQPVQALPSYERAVVFRRDVLMSGPEGFAIRGWVGERCCGTAKNASSGGRIESGPDGDGTPLTPGLTATNYRGEQRLEK